MQEFLFLSASLELFVLRLAYRTRVDDTELVFDNGMVLSREQCQRSFGDWFHGILDFCQALHALDVDISAFACLCALTLVTGKFTTLSTLFNIQHCKMLNETKNEIHFGKKCKIELVENENMKCIVN